LRDELWARTFPLLAPDSRFDDPRIETTALGALKAQGLQLSDLRVPETPQLFFKHEERPLFVVPGKLRVNEPRRDELNRGRLKVNLSFTLPPGAYATLVVRRVLWFADTAGHKPAPAAVTPPSPEPPRPKPERIGFLEQQRRKKEARIARRKKAT